MLLFLLFAQTATSIPHLSVTFDEPVHVLTGYSIWRTGDLRLLEDHPPLLEMWMSWPLLLSPDLPAPEQVPTWETGDRRLFAHHDIWWTFPIDSWLVPARITIALLAVLLVALVYRWATDSVGVLGGLLALFLLAFDPNLLAHARLATLDLGVTLLIFATLYVFQRTLKASSARRWLVTGGLLGLTLAAKASGLVLLPVMSIVMLWWSWRHWQFKTLLGYALLCFGFAVLVLWGAHLFSFGSLEGVPFPVPFPTYFRSVLRIGDTITDTGRRAYLLGQVYQGGRWTYFPVTFLFKTPLAGLLLAVLAACCVKYKQFIIAPRHQLRTWLAAGVCILYAGISVNSQINIGYRHLIPILPFLYLLISRLATVWNGAQFHKRLLRLFVYAMMLWQVIGTVGIWPWHLTYFNALAGGTQQGYRYLADSNVDWGQALKAVDAYLDEHGITDAYLSHFTYFIQPHGLYGIEAQPLPPAQDAPPLFPRRYNPEPGTYIISASSLRGLQGVDEDGYSWFAHREPDDMIANAMLVYEVPEPTHTPSWVAQCSVPAVPLSTEQIQERFGVDDLRLVSFDCTQSWLYPGGGAESGWYVLHTGVTQPLSTFIRTNLDGANVVFEQTRNRESPALSVYSSSPQPITYLEPAISASGTIHAASALWPAAQAVAEGTTLSTPVTFDGPLSFLGYALSEQNQQVELITYWEVESIPGTLFSIMAHLVGNEVVPLAVGDGFGIPIDQMQVGDVVAQRHTFALPEQCSNETCWFKVGAYWLDNQERWTITATDQAADALFIPVN